MGQALSPARARATIDLQNIRNRRSVNSLEFAVADHAITLVLNPARVEDDFLVVNALRDARSILLRQRQRDTRRYAPVEAMESTDGLTMESPSAGLCRSPEAVLIANDGYRSLKAWGDRRPVRTARCLKQWYAGFTAAESARENGSSLRTERAERAGVRAAALSILAGVA